ncbi:transcriptional regulator [Fusibacter sp. 3D3]|uniref:transcriptional regulator n=1 Tax=Fusibacter sp. 3D3 TaxID=1048380 RepID=UPI000853CEA0|nr:transcriptional regulator [Fusibacter sp. 3D3]GAU78155.1 hypothetical protein F3D3_2787 [Fusibacter sp. 3D3]
MIEIYDNYKEFGILTRKITEGKEFDMVRKFIDFKKNEFNKTSENDLAIFIEPKVNNAYPDVVFVEYNPDNYEKWIPNRNNISNIELKILYHMISSGPLNASDIVAQLGVNWKDVMLSVEKLYDSKLIQRRNKNWSVKSKKTIFLNKIEAVEAKIGKVNDVLQQAIINKAFASESYILSNKNAKVNATWDKFEEFGIGIYLNEDDHFLRYKKSNINSFPVSFQSILFNEWIGRILNSSDYRGAIND